MRKKVLDSVLVCFLVVLFGTGYATGASICSADKLQQSGSVYRICMPPAGEYNGSVVIWAHGFQDAGTPVHIPEEQLEFGDVSIPGLINQLGFGFATNSYSKTGLAVRQGMADILDLVTLYTEQQGAPEHVYLVGASEGGLITTLLVEQRPETFNAGLAVCGPVGDFPLQINYFGDARVTFQYFFPSVIPGNIFAPSDALVANWSNYYTDVVQPAVFAPANRHLLDQWVRVARLPFDPERYLETVGVSVRDVLRYAVVNLKDVARTLGGFPFDNRTRRYSGSDNDLLLNLRVLRRSAAASAVQEMRAHYNTTGRLQRPLITLHTLRDQQVPYLHEVLYDLKTLVNGSFLIDHVNIPVNRFGHCNVTATEAVGAFALMLLYAGDQELLLSRLDTVLSSLDLEVFARLAQQYGIPSPSAHGGGISR